MCHKVTNRGHSALVTVKEVLLGRERRSFYSPGAGRLSADEAADDLQARIDGQIARF